MNHKASEIIDAVLCSLEPELEPDFFRWVEADTVRNQRWVDITDRFEEGMVEAMKTRNIHKGKREGEIYKSDMLSLIREFNSTTGKNETISFLKALEDRRELDRQ